MSNVITQRVSTRFIATALFAVAAFLFISSAQAEAVAPIVDLHTEEFVTVDGSFKGISVGFNTEGFGTTTAVTVELTREDGSTITKTANQGVLDIINDAVGVAHLTAPFVIQEGTFTEASDTQYWNPAPTDWSVITRPVEVTITVTDEDGSRDVTNNTFNEGSPSWPTYESLLTSTTEVHVSNQTELELALAHVDVTSIILDSSFDVNTKILISHPVTIDGNGFSISSDVVDPTVWNSSTAYILHIYNTTDVVIKNIELTNSNAAILVNGSTASLEGTIDVSGNGFGGIESSDGSVLTVSASLINDTEAYGQPTIWEDGITGTTVVGFTGTTNSTIKPTQVQYYMGSHGVVRNEAQLNSALADNNIPVITVGEDFNLDTAVQINRSVTIEGAGHTLTAESSVVNNAILITANDVTVKDLTIDGDDNNIHGLQAYKAVNADLENVTVLNNGKSGITVNGSTVTVTNVTTTDNSWGGINVDQGTGVTEVTTLTVNGTSHHTEVNADIWKDDNAKTDVSVVDTNSQYDASAYVHDTTITGTEYFLKPVRSNGGGGGGSKSMRDRDNDEEDEVVEEEVLGAATSTDSIGTSTPVAYYNFTVDFGIGSEGTDVTNLQTILMAAGHLDIDAPTGFFGPMTFAAVQAYQTANSISNTGFVGPLTRAQLNTVPVVKTETVQSQIDAILAKIAELQAQLDAMNAE